MRKFSLGVIHQDTKELWICAQILNWRYPKYSKLGLFLRFNQYALTNLFLGSQFLCRLLGHRRIEYVTEDGYPAWYCRWCGCAGLELDFLETGK